jgi:hypothetical protein
MVWNEDPNNQEILQTVRNGYDLNISNFEPSTNVSLDTFRIILRRFMGKNSRWSNFG